MSSSSTESSPKSDLKATTKKLEVLLELYKSGRESTHSGAQREFDKKSVHPQEAARKSQWEELNRNLRLRGLNPINLRQENDVFLLDGMAVQMLQSTLLSLMAESDSKQRQIDLWIETAHTDKINLREEQERNKRLATELSRVGKQLSVEAKKVEELERARFEELKRHGEEMQRLRQNHLGLEGRYKQLEVKCRRQEKSIGQLHQKHQKLFEKSESQTQSRRWGTFDVDSPITSTRLLNDAYKRKISGLEEELDFLRKEVSVRNGHSSSLSNSSYMVSLDDRSSSYQNSSYLSLHSKLKRAEQRAVDLKRQLDHQEVINRELRAELETRPKAEELREMEMRIKSLEKVDDSKAMPSCNETHVCSASIDTCRKYLQFVCRQLNVGSLPDLMPALRGMTSSMENMRHFVATVIEVIDRGPQPHCPDGVRHEAWCDLAWDHVIPTLEYWLGLLVTSESDGIPGSVACRNAIQHFKNLFDVKSSAGVLPKLNEVYSRVTEVNNFVKALGEKLNLGPEASCVAIMRQIDVLIVLVGDEYGLDRFQQVRYHDETSSLFETVVAQLMMLLGLNRAEEIIPEVTKMKRFLSDFS